MSALSTSFGDAAIMLRRNFKHTARNPVTVFNAILFPIVIMLMFVYVFGGAFKVHGAYIDYAVPGLLVMAVCYGLGPTAAAVNGDMTTGVINRFKTMDVSFGAVLAGSKADIAAVRDWRHVYGASLYQAWMPALLALDALPGFRGDIGKAHQRARQLIDALVAGGKARERSSPDASNIYWLEMPQALADAAFERGRTAGIRIGRWKDGRIGTVRSLRPYGGYGAVVFRKDSVAQSPAKPKTGYEELVKQIVTFFETKKPPVPNDETLEIFAFMDAAQRSKEAGGKPVRLR